MQPSSILARACERHGGDSAEAALHRPLGLEIEKLDGPIPRGKGLGLSYHAPARATVVTAAREVTFHDYPEAGRAIVYRDGVVDENVRRARFDGAKKFATWSPHDAAYFFGYALSEYLGLPFSLRERELVEQQRAGDLDVLWFRFPDGADTHSRVQGFYFDPSGLLVRHDYHAEILGPLFYGAHLTRDYVEKDGRLFAKERAVYAKLGHVGSTSRTRLRVLHARLAV